MTDPNSNPAADALTIARLAALSPVEYDRCRTAEADALGCRVATLDAMVTRARGGAGVADDLDDPKPPQWSDESLALRFSAQHADRLRYVAGWGRWLIYDGGVWVPDATMQSFDFARTICRAASAECNDHNIAPVIAAHRTVASVERLARADRRHAATADQWDTDPWLLNTPAGVLDLRTGDMAAHQASRHMTKMTAIAPDGDCPLWRTFLARVTDDDRELQLFIQRMAGYCLTGLTREHALFFAHGLGGNGKGVFLNTLAAILANYAAVASMETFTASPGERHPADLAMLRGARLVTAQETEEGRRWAEARIKALTGGDPVTARFMRQDFFTFTPQFKLIIAGNHKPGLRSVDDAIRRRFNLIPFAVRISAEERDRELSEKLRAEWPGILAWAVDGCLSWQDRGLAPPPIVQAATADYLEGEDAMALWLDERCIVKPSFHTTSGELFGCWKRWAELAGEFVGSQKRFSQALEARGFIPKRQAGTGRHGFEGIGLKPAEPHWYDQP